MYTPLGTNPLGYADINAGANAAKAIKVTITADSTQLGSATKQAVSQLNELKSAGMALLSGFTGGLVGGGILGAVTGVVNLIGGQIRSVRELMRDAESLNVDFQTAWGYRNLSKGTGLPIAEAVQGTRRARAEALAGDPNFTEAFAQLGVDLEKIRSVNPGVLFNEVVKAMKALDPESKNFREQFDAVGRILGSRKLAEDLTPFARGGLFEEGRFYTQSGGIFADALAGNGIFSLSDPMALQKYKKDFEAPGSFGIGDQTKAARMDENIRERVLALTRSQMSVEQQITMIIERRNALEKEISETGDVVKQRRLREKMLTLDESLVALSANQSKEIQARMPNVRTDADEFARRGLYIGGGQGMSLQEQQVQRLTGIEQGIRQLLATTNLKW